MSLWKLNFSNLQKLSLRHFKTPLSILAGAGILTALLLNFEFNIIEAGLYDFRMAKGPQARPDSRITLITLDDATTATLDDLSPLSLEVHARFLESLEKYSPRGVGYLVDMNRVSQLYPQQFRSHPGQKFTEIAIRMERGGTPVIMGTSFDVTGEVLPPYPLSALPHALALIHKDGNVFARDKVTRSALTHLYDKSVFHFELARKLGLISEGHLPRGSFSVPEVDANYFNFRYHGDVALSHASQLSDSERYRRLSFLDVLNGTAPIDSLRDKIVLVGTLTRDDSQDYALTPYSSASFSNPKLAVHANILDSLINDDGVAKTPHYVNVLAIFLLSVFVIAAVMILSPLNGLFATVAVIILFLTFTQLVFYGFGGHSGLWIRVSQPLIGAFLGYYLAVPYRLIREYKKRWDYQRKNKLLVQVEELKTNFMSLVTHDLKTPVARIQGLAEVLLKKAADRLVDRDKETLNHIIQSTDELNRFISSILELAKVESNYIHLRLESKDVNSIIERATAGFRAQARAKNCKITMNLEPLFPIKVDVSMITKVLNNLIDNAIKYSDPGSEISILSVEKNEWVQISVRDQGVGLSPDEIESLFKRFYRAKNQATAQTSGTGLGLYLSKFFIEAHQGRVEVESEQGIGSTFRILLPILPTLPPAAMIRPGLTVSMPEDSGKSSEESTYV